MEITAVNTRKDIFLMQFALAWRLRINYYAFGIMVVFAGFMSWEWIARKGYVYWIVQSLVVGIIAFYTLILVGTLFQLLTVSVEKGYLGEHVFRADEAGFHEKTAATEMLTAWSAIEQVYVTRKYIYLKIDITRIHIIPRRSFQSEEEFISFRDLIAGYLKNR